MDERPIVRALIAHPRANGQVSSVQLVSLAAAYLALRDRDAAGRPMWIAVGPDPADMEALAAWERAQQFNPPRLESGE